MQLCEILQQLLAKGGPFEEQQEALATILGTDSPMISKIKFFKPEWESHFELFLKLVPLCELHGIDAWAESARSLNSSPQHITETLINAVTAVTGNADAPPPPKETKGGGPPTSNPRNKRNPKKGGPKKRSG